MWTAAPFVALALQSALAGTAALVAPRSKPLALFFGVSAFVGAPWFAGPNTLLRGLSALLGWVELLRIIDVVRVGDRERWRALRRVLHVASFVDTRSLKRSVSLRIDPRACGAGLLWLALAAASFYLLAPSSRRPPLLHPLVWRWGAGLAFAYATIEAGYAFASGALYRVLGFTTPRLHVWPIASQSIGELWGVRWARPISQWLRETCFRPLARRGHPMVGLLLGFVVSAIGHAYPVFVAIGGPMAAMMFAFFLLQGLFVMLEVRLGASRWPRFVRRVWTVALMLATAPLFVEPALRVVLGLPSQ